jgi:hypothetical protein
MTTECRDPEPLEASSEVDEIVNNARVTAEELAVQEARLAADRAVMSIFELAFSLESLSDAIGRFNSETRRQLREWQHADVGIDGGV